MTDQRSSGEQWRVDLGDEGFFLEAPDGTCWGLNKVYSHPEDLPKRLNNRPDLGTDWRGIAGRLAGTLKALLDMRRVHSEIYGYEKQHYVIDINAEWEAAAAALAEYEGESRA